MSPFGQTRQQAIREFEGEPVLKEAAAESHSQPGRVVSGNGRLALTEKKLIFEQRVPDRVLRIPRGSIVDVATKRPFNLRIFPRLLRIAWVTESGGQDSVVLTVKGIDAWIEALGQPGQPL